MKIFKLVTSVILSLLIGFLIYWLYKNWVEGLTPFLLNSLIFVLVMLLLVDIYLIVKTTSNLSRMGLIFVLLLSTAVSLFSVNDWRKGISNINKPDKEFRKYLQ